MQGKKVWFIAVVALLVLAAAVPLFLRQQPAARAEQDQAKAGVSVLAINVGKADSVLVWTEGKVYLVDTGAVQSFGALKTALDKLQITRLDGVFLTHTDKDHMGGMAMLEKSGIAVDAWYGSAMYTDIKLEKHGLALAAAARGMEPIWLKAGDTVTVSENAAFSVLGPITLDENNENNNSLVMMLTTPHGRVLLTGDMEFEAESALLAAGSIVPCEILKVAHHGEDDSTSPAFAQRVSPQIALISTDSVAEPDTPAPIVLAELKRTGAKIAVTQNARGGMLATLTNGQATVEPVEWSGLPGLQSALRLTALNAQEDVLSIENTGAQAVSLAGWYLFSTRGDEAFFFPADASIAPGATVRIGSQTTATACDWIFEDKNVWHNKRLDEAVLYDPYGRAVARIGNGMAE